jgi:hypothetical protein
VVGGAGGCWGDGEGAEGEPGALLPMRVAVGRSGREEVVMPRAFLRRLNGPEMDQRFGLDVWDTTDAENFFSTLAWQFISIFQYVFFFVTFI